MERTPTRPRQATDKDGTGGQAGPISMAHPDEPPKVGTEG